MYGLSFVLIVVCMSFDGVCERPGGTCWVSVIRISVFL